MSAVATKSGRPTKQAIADRDATIAELEEQVAQLHDDIDQAQGERDAANVTLLNTVAELEAAKAKLESVIAEHTAAVDTLVEQYEADADLHADEVEIWDNAAQGVNEVARELFSRLTFAATTLANIVAYGGEQVDIVRAIAEASLNDLQPFVEQGAASGAFEYLFQTVVEGLYPEVTESDWAGLDWEVMLASLGSDASEIAILNGLSVVEGNCDPDCVCAECEWSDRDGAWVCPNLTKSSGHPIEG